MKRLFIILVAAVAFGWAGNASAQNSYVAAGSGTNSCSGCTSITVSVTTGAHHLMVVYVAQDHVSTLTIADTLSHSYGAGTCIDTINDNSTREAKTCYVLDSGTGGSNTVTCSSLAAGFTGCIVQEYSIPGTIQLTASGFGTGTSATPSVTSSAGAITGNLAVVMFDASLDSLTSPSGYTCRFSAFNPGTCGSTDYVDGFDNLSISSNGAQTVTAGAAGGANHWIGQIVVFTAVVAPTITSFNSATFTLGVNGTFAVTATGNPTPTFSKTGSLPSAVTFSSAGVLSGIPGAGTAGTYPIVITATNGIAPDATQNFTLTVALASYLTGQLISAPLLPQVTPSAVYPPDTGYTLTAVASGANLQTAITAAACGTKLNLAHGGTFTAASPWTLPNNSCSCHTDPTKWQIIQGDQFEANYVPGVRVDPSAQYAQFPHLSNSDANYAFQVITNADNCWGFAGLDVTTSTDGANAVFSWGDGSFTVANFPHDVAWWGDYIHGQASKGLTRCIMFNGNWGAVVDSYLSDCHKVGQDSQAIEMWDGLGPLLVQNTFLEGAAENILIGGADPHAGVIPSDFTFQKNHFFKPLSWRVADPSSSHSTTDHWSVKNCFELKDAQRVLITGNVFENGWGDGQNGQCITWNSSNQSGNDPQAVIADYNMYYNVIRHFTGAYVIAGNTNPTYQSDHRLNIHDNLSWDIDSCKWGNCFFGAIPDVSIGGINPGTLYAPFDLWINHETIASNPATQSFGVNFQPTDSTPYYGFQDTNSIIDRSIYRAFGRTVGNETGLAPGGKFNNDCIYGPSSGDTYTDPAYNGKQLVLSGQSGVFVNPGVDFHVAPASPCYQAGSDSKSMGADIDAVNAATAGVTEALANPHTVTNVSPSTFTHLGSTSITITGTNFISGAAEVIVGGAGPVVAVSTDICAVNTCTVVMSAPITLAVNDTVNMAGMNANNSNQGQFLVASVTDTTHFTYTDNGIGVRSWTGGTANRLTPGNACASVVVVNSTTITCTTPAATGTVTNGSVSVFECQFGICAQFNGANYN